MITTLQRAGVLFLTPEEICTDTHDCSRIEAFSASTTYARIPAPLILPGPAAITGGRPIQPKMRIGTQQGSSTMK